MMNPNLYIDGRWHWRGQKVGDMLALASTRASRPAIGWRNGSSRLISLSEKTFVFSVSRKASPKRRWVKQLASHFNKCKNMKTAPIGLGRAAWQNSPKFWAYR